MAWRGKMHFFFSKLGVKVSGQYCLDISLFQQTIGAIKRVANDNFIYLFYLAYLFKTLCAIKQSRNSNK